MQEQELKKQVSSDRYPGAMAIENALNIPKKTHSLHMRMSSTIYRLFIQMAVTKV